MRLIRTITQSHAPPAMRRAIIILSVVAAIAAEAPYHLPRPAAHAPVLHYPIGPAPAPAPAPQFPPQQLFLPNSGYNYPAPQFNQPSNPPPPPPPAPSHHHHHHHHYPQSAPAPAPAPVYIPAPAPQPLPIAPRPLPIPQPQPLPVNYPQPQPIYSQPSPSYGVPQPGAPAPAPAPVPISALPVFAPQPAPQPLPQLQPQAQINSVSQLYQPVAYQQQEQQQQYSQQGYNYQQPQALPQFQPQAQAFPAPAASVLSSYQADSNQYSSAQEQTHRDALDSLVVSRVQDIIKDNEHSSARNAGYQSLVSGVSLGQAKPSVEISSFVHTSPLATGSVATSEALSSSIASGSASIPSTDYGVPSVSPQGSTGSQSAASASGFNFLPQNKPAISYGPPN